jgi:hypothetical protein
MKAVKVDTKQVPTDDAMCLVAALACADTGSSGIWLRRLHLTPPRALVVGWSGCTRTRGTLVAATTVELSKQIRRVHRLLWCQPDAGDMGASRLAGKNRSTVP